MTAGLQYPLSADPEKSENNAFICVAEFWPYTDLQAETLAEIGGQDRPSVTNSRVGSEDTAAKIIAYYVPERFRQKGRWVPPQLRGKVITFPALKESA